MFEHLPKRLKNPYCFALIGFILGHIIPLIHSLISGKEVKVGCGLLGSYTDYCYSIVPTNDYEWGGFVARSTVWVLGSLIMYWWEIGRKGGSDKTR